MEISGKKKYREISSPPKNPWYDLIMPESSSKDPGGRPTAFKQAYILCAEEGFTDRIFSKCSVFLRKLYAAIS